MSKSVKGYRLSLRTDAACRRFNGRYTKAQKWLDNEVVKDCTPFVPMRSGNLFKSGILGTRLGSGTVQYIAPYASRMYKGKHIQFYLKEHPQATYEWFEKAKALKKKDWIKGSDKIVRGEV